MTRLTARAPAGQENSRPAPARTVANMTARTGSPQRMPGARAMIVRDIPASCICLWDWDADLGKWGMARPLPGCPWHEGS